MITQETRNYLMDTYMTSATEQEQKQIRRDVEIYYTVIHDMAKRGELTSEQVKARITTKEMYGTLRMLNGTIEHIGENSTNVIAYDVIVDNLAKILKLI
ncbi:hypothetical protein KQUDLBSD_CDS0207 [Staphylococcus phage PG-2021_40]